MSVTAQRVGRISVPLPSHTRACTRCGRVRETNTTRTAAVYVCQDCRLGDPEWLRMISEKEGRTA